MIDRKIIYNAIRTPDETLLVSYYAHDIKQHNDAISGELYVCDGGLEYLRRSVNDIAFEELSLYDDEPFAVIRKYLSWGTRGKEGLNTLKYIPIQDLSMSHVEAILASNNGSRWFIEMLKKECQFRSIN